MSAKYCHVPTSILPHWVSVYDPMDRVDEWLREAGIKVSFPFESGADASLLVGGPGLTNATCTVACRHEHHAAIVMTRYG